MERQKPTKRERLELIEKLKEFIQYNSNLLEAGQEWRVDHQMMFIRNNQARLFLELLEKEEWKPPVSERPKTTSNLKDFNN